MKESSHLKAVNKKLEDELRNIHVEFEKVPFSFSKMQFFCSVDDEEE